MKLDTFSTQMLEKGLDSAWLRYRVASNNLANYETPSYKARKVDFRQVLSECKSPLHGGQREEASYKAFITYDERTEARVDGNNVSQEYEQMEVWRAQAQYAYLTQKAVNYYSTLRDVMTTFAK